MKFNADYFPLMLTFICAIVIVVIIEKDPSLANASGLPDAPVSPPPSYLNVGQAGFSHDPETPDIAVYFPAGAISDPIELKAFYVESPEDVSPPDDSSLILPLNRLPVSDDREPDADANADEDSSRSQAAAGDVPLISDLVTIFSAGVWIRGGIEGKGTTVNQFNDHSIMIVVKYDANDLPQDKLYLYMYNPTVRSWVKLCTLVDPYLKEISGVLHTMTPYEDHGNSLFAVGVDETSVLEQVVVTNGATTISLPEMPEMTLTVPAGVVQPGVNFEITPVIRTDAGVMIDYKACHLNHASKKESQELVHLARPIEIEFTLPAPAGEEIGVSTFYQGRWHDPTTLQTVAESFGVAPVYTYDPTHNEIVANSALPGVYGFEVRPRQARVAIVP